MKTYIYFLAFLFILYGNTAAQWYEQNSGFSYTVHFEECYFINAENGWVAGTKILKTTDGGETWIEKQPWGITNGWSYSIFFIDSLNGFTGEESRLYKTTDGGNNWDIVYSRSEFGYKIMSIYFADNNRGWIVGGRYDSLAILWHKLLMEV
jgi:photosystem II stability/assembly factor-like uncharacterized protein